jgi:hypothetical protein
MTAATHSGIEALARFAQGVQEDLAAVKVGLSVPWSNGPVEGQITRLKWLKRQGYGRAGFPLWRQRILQAALARLLPFCQAEGCKKILACLIAALATHPPIWGPKVSSTSETMINRESPMVSRIARPRTFQKGCPSSTL